MKYVKLERLKTTYVDGMKKAHSTDYAETTERNFTDIRWIHIKENVERLEWECYEVFIHKSGLWFWGDIAFETFHKAYNAAKNDRKIYT